MNPKHPPNNKKSALNNPLIIHKSKSPKRVKKESVFRSIPLKFTSALSISSFTAFFMFSMVTGSPFISSFWAAVRASGIHIQSNM